MSDDSKHWGKLLQAIAKGVVIPIVGRGLLRIRVDGREQMLYDYLAAQLAAQLGVECDPADGIDQVVADYLNQSRRNSRDDVNLKAYEILSQLRDADGAVPYPSRSASWRPSSPCDSSSTPPSIRCSRTRWVHPPIMSSPMRRMPRSRTSRATTPARPTASSFISSVESPGFRTARSSTRRRWSSSGSFTKSPCPRASPISLMNCAPSASS